jgi:[acyl-carrier-protein] S-malonyltransferase
MFTPWLDLDGARDQVGEWSEAAGLDLLRLGTTAEAQEIQDTAVTQPLIVALSLLAFEHLRARIDIPERTVFAGHSVGELAAAAAAGVFSPVDAMALAGLRGREMAAACSLAPTGMAAVMRGEPDDVLAWLERHDLVPANRNGAGQTVAAGLLSDLDAAVAEPPEGVKVIRLKVAGAFHTKYMEPAQQALRAKAADIEVRDPAHRLLSNADGQVVASGKEMLDRLVAQVVLPVRWDLCMETLRELDATVLAELPPSGALVGLARRELKGTTIVGMKTPEQVAEVAELIKAEASA